MSFHLHHSHWIGQSSSIDKNSLRSFIAPSLSAVTRVRSARSVAIAALRPVSREQVEKVWRGEWIGDDDEKVGTIDGSPTKSATCSVCGNWLVGSDEYDCSGHFCPACGRAMTDEAVQMVMERMETINNA